MINIKCKCGTTIMSFYDQENESPVFVRQKPVFLQGKLGFMLHWCKHHPKESYTLLFQDNGLPLIRQQEYALWKKLGATNQARHREYRYLCGKTETEFRQSVKEKYSETS